MTAASERANPLESPRLRLYSATFVFVTSLAIYYLTMSPTVGLVDSGELTVAAHGLGVAHPPGFPLYVLLTHLITLVPVGSVAARVNFASALFAAMASAMLSLVVAEILLTRRAAPAALPTGRGNDRGKKNKKAPLPISKPDWPAPDNASAPNSDALISVAPCLLSGLLFACSRTLWAYATVAEVYTLNSLLILVVFFFVLRWRRTQMTEARTPQARRDRPLLIAAFAFGLGLGVHHVTAALMLPAYAVVVWRTGGSSFFASKRLLHAALAAFAGLSVYIYLPVAASRSPVMNWGDPRTIERFIWHFTGRQYQNFFDFSFHSTAVQMNQFLDLLVYQFGPWWVPAALALAALGLVFSFKRDRTAFWFLVLAMCLDLLYGLGYEIAEDKDAYYLPFFIALSAAAGLGAHWLLGEARLTAMSAGIRRAVALSAAMVVPLVAFAGNLPYNNRGRFYVAEDYAENILKSVAPGGMLLTLDWQVYSPMLYLREVEHRRPDAIVIDVNQLRRSWYFDYLERAYPQVMAEARAEADAFLEDLRHWEQDPDLYNRDVALNNRISARFNTLILALVANQTRSGPVYVTQEIPTMRGGRDIDWANALNKQYQFFPQGIVFQAARDDQFHEPAGIELSTRGLADGTVKYDKQDVIKQKVLPVYVSMLYNNGLYLARANRHARAVEFFSKSLTLDPEFKAARQALGESQAQLKQGAGGAPQ